MRGTRELAAFIELCRIKVVRIISIHDRIDTRGELFSDTTVTEVLNMFGALPEEVAVLRKSSDHIMRLQQNIKAPATTKKNKTKTERDKAIVDMYKNGHLIEDILVSSGFSSKSSIWRILNKNGVKLDRGRTKGPRVKQKPKEDETDEGNT